MIGVLLGLVRATPVASSLIAAGTALAIGGAGAWWARGFVYDTIEKPALIHSIEQIERAACTIRTQDAATAAEKAERLRQTLAGAAALKAYREKAEARARLQADVQTQLEAEIAENEARLAGSGRSCLADQSDVEWLRSKSE